MGLPVRLFNGFTHLMNSIGTLWVFGMMFLICTDIFARNVFNFPLNGVPEVIAFSIAGTDLSATCQYASFGAVYACRTPDRLA